MQTGEIGEGTEKAYGANVGVVKGSTYDAYNANQNNYQSAVTDRSALQAEMDQLCAEIDRVAATANFNKVRLFDGNLATKDYDKIAMPKGGPTTSADSIAEVAKLLGTAVDELKSFLATIKTEVSDEIDAIEDADVAVYQTKAAFDGATVTAKTANDAYDAAANAVGTKGSVADFAKIGIQDDVAVGQAIDEQILGLGIAGVTNLSELNSLLGLLGTAAITQTDFAFTPSVPGNNNGTLGDVGAAAKIADALSKTAAGTGVGLVAYNANLAKEIAQTDYTTALGTQKTAKDDLKTAVVEYLEGRVEDATYALGTSGLSEEELEAAVTALKKEQSYLTIFQGMKSEDLFDALAGDGSVQKTYGDLTGSKAYVTLISAAQNFALKDAGYSFKVENDNFFVQAGKEEGETLYTINSFSINQANLETFRTPGTSIKENDLDKQGDPYAHDSKTLGQGLTLQIGETSNAADKLIMNVGRMNTDTLFANLTAFANNDGDSDVRLDINSSCTVKGIIGYTIDISGQQRASAAAEGLNSVINKVSIQRAELGAMQNRLDYTIDNLNTAVENVTASNSRIRDTDMAKEMTKFTMQNVLLQSAQSMLAQANAQPQNVLSLLR
jgi:flagellin